MLTEKQHQAKNLFFQTELTKTQIADLLNVGRRTLHYWIRENNWERLKKSSSTLPAMLAENCYVIIAKYTEALMSEVRIKRPITPQEAETLHKLSLTVKKLKNHSTLNESMEMFAHFMERINKVSPDLADQVMPFVSDYIEERAAINPALFKPEKLNDQGFIPLEAEDPTESQKDFDDIMAWERESGQLNEVDIEAFRTMDKEPAQHIKSAPLTDAPISHDDAPTPQFEDTNIQSGDAAVTTLQEAYEIHAACGAEVARHKADLEERKRSIIEEIQRAAA